MLYRRAAFALAAASARRRNAVSQPVGRRPQHPPNVLQDEQLQHPEKRYTELKEKKVKVPGVNTLSVMIACFRRFGRTRLHYSSYVFSFFSFLLFSSIYVVKD